VIFANVISWYLCWYTANEWLNGFNDRIDLLPWFIAVVTVAVVVTLLLAWGTVAAHALKLARTSPIFAPGYE